MKIVTHTARMADSEKVILLLPRITITLRDNRIRLFQLHVQYIYGFLSFNMYVYFEMCFVFQKLGYDYRFPGTKNKEIQTLTIYSPLCAE